MYVRAPDPGDAPAVLELIVARDVADLGRPDFTLEDLLADWAAPGIDPARDAWLVEDCGGPLGYALLDDRLQLLPDAHGACRGAEPPAEGPVRPLSRGADDAPVHALVEEPLAAVPGNEPRSLESWQAAKIDKQGWDSSLLHDDADGLAGVVLCERWEDGVGYVDYLAVASCSRGRGLGRALLLHGIAALRTVGLAVAELSVQGENAGATRLYESVGMSPVWTIERWE